MGKMEGEKMAYSDKIYKKEKLISRTFYIDEKLYLELERLSKEVYEASISKLMNVAIEELVEKEIETIGSLSLSFFLTMALMGLKLGQLFDLALPLIIMLIAQSILIALFASFITYKVMGKNYEAAVFASATCGFGMGATPNAIANMDELTNRFGFTPTPYFVVPLVGGLFIDFINSGIITIFINLFS